MYGSTIVNTKQVYVPDSLQGTVSVVQEDPTTSGTDVSPICERVPASTLTQPVPVKSKGGPHFQYDKAIAKLKEAGAEAPPGVPVIHGEVHKECFPPLQRNYGAGIKYLLTGDEGAKKLVMSKKCKYEPNVRRFFGGSTGFIKGFTVNSGPSHKFQNINLTSLGAALRKADRETTDTNISPLTPREPFSSAKFDSEALIVSTNSKSSNVVEDCKEITTIDWGCL